MAPVIIPWFDPPEFLQQIVLSGVVYKIRAKYNTRSKRWVFSILTAASGRLLDGIRLSKGVNLLEHNIDSRLPRGQLFLVGDGEENKNNVGASIQLYYFE